MKRLLCLRLPNWSVQRLRAEQTDFQADLLLLHRRDPRRGELVVACCEQSRRRGVRVGMSLAEAAELVASDVRRAIAVCPDEPTADLAALGRLAEHCELYSPRVGWETMASRTVEPSSRRSPPWFGDSPGHLFLDVSGIPHLFGGEEPLAREVITSCRDLGYDGRLAIAGTLGASWAVAGTGEPITVVPPDAIEPSLHPLPVGSLRLPAELVETLSRLGIQTIDQLRRLPRADLARRFGPLLLVRLDQALGSAAEILIPYRSPPTFEASQQFDFPTDRRDVLDGVITDLIGRITEQLQAHGRAAVRLTGELGCGPDGDGALEVPMYRPTDLAKPLLEVVRLHCERLILPGPVERVSLRADQTIRLRPCQAPLFADPASNTDESLAVLLDRLAARLGARSVVRPVGQADALPERAFRFVPLVGQRTSSRSPAQEAAMPTAVSHRPMRLFSPPLPIDAVAPVPDGPAATFHWQGQRYIVARHWGPERIETGWWRRGLVRRDYYRVETTQGRRFWLFRDLIGGAWYLHGSFE
jgi:protein ImuB